LKAWLFEINDHPSLNILLEKEGPKGLIKFPSEIDKYIKVKVVGEAIKLMKNRKIDRNTVEAYKGWHRILPSPDFQEYDVFYKAKQIFDRLVERKGASMSNAKFAKLGKLKGMTNGTTLTPVHYDLLFKSVLSKRGVAKMTLEVFFDALEEIGALLFPLELDQVEAVISRISEELKL